MAFGPGSQATGQASIALGLLSQAPDTASISIGSGLSPNIASSLASVAIGNNNTVNGAGSFAVGGYNTIDTLSSSSYIFGRGNSTSTAHDTQNSFVVGRDNVVNGQDSYLLGRELTSESYWETVIGSNNTDYVPKDSANWNTADRLFTIGNGDYKGGYPLGHNALTMWKDGSFAYNDDNFQNDTVGEQNMFYFNYGNHNGNGGPNSKKAIRLGSSSSGDWDITSASVGDKSIALGFGTAMYGHPNPIASGTKSFAVLSGITSGSDSFAAGVFGTEASGPGSVAFGYGTLANGEYATTFGAATIASGILATAFGDSTTASGESSVAFGLSTIASGSNASTFGATTSAFSYGETAVGTQNTNYSPGSSTVFDNTDRAFVVGNGNGSASDALTVLKNGETGINVDNFETNTNGLGPLQVGDGTTNIIGYVDGVTGAWVAVSDERKKKNIEDLSYSLETLMQLRPVSFEYKRNNEHTIGFLAQEVQPFVPEAVFGDAEKGYGMAYDRLVPVTVKAIQELNLKITDIENFASAENTTFLQNLIAWLGDAGNGIGKLFTHEVHTDTLCVGQTCVTESQLQQLLNGQGVSSGVSSGFGYGYGGGN